MRVQIETVLYQPGMDMSNVDMVLIEGFIDDEIGRERRISPRVRPESFPLVQNCALNAASQEKNIPIKFIVNNPLVEKAHLPSYAASTIPIYKLFLDSLVLEQNNEIDFDIGMVRDYLLNKKILLVDDDQMYVFQVKSMVLNLVSEKVISGSYLNLSNIKDVYSKSATLEMVFNGSQDLDMIIMDRMLGANSGNDLAGQIKRDLAKQGRKVPFILGMSAAAHKTDETHHFDYFILKEGNNVFKGIEHAIKTSSERKYH